MLKPSEWCRNKWETTFDPAYIELYEYWKEKEDAKDSKGLPSYSGTTGT